MQTSTADLPFGITVIDSGLVRPGVAASYLVREGQQAAFIETGPAHAVPALLQALALHGLAREEVAYVVVTHVHLDHAAGAGALLAALPRAKLVVHPRGVRHLVDPSRLLAGATEVYGAETVQERFGLVVPAPAERVMAAGDGFVLELGARRLAVIDTPGHALHHFVLFDERSRGLFSGDAFGLHYAALDGPTGPFVFPTTTPVQFDPQGMHASIDRLIATGAERVYFTHFGPIEGGVAEVGDELHRLVDAYVELAERSAGAPSRQAALEGGMQELLLGELARHGCPLSLDRQRELLAMDVTLNAQGLAVWLDKRHEPRRGPVLSAPG
jgi:glyoxylase-like metal-dependent hydrolase (beta-lactamase superfamily II)